MQKTIISLMILTLFFGLAGEANALTRTKVIDRAREFTTVSWSISDTAVALYDSPHYRYPATSTWGNHSPLFEWIRDHNDSDWDGDYFGAPYAYGGRITPIALFSIVIS